MERAHTLNFTPIFLQSLVPTWVQSSLTTSSVSKASLTLSMTFAYTPFLAAENILSTTNSGYRIMHPCLLSLIFSSLLQQERIVIILL